MVQKQIVKNCGGLPPPIYKRIEETVAILNYHYGENCNIDQDLGGYILVIENKHDFAEFKKIFSKEVSNIIIEYSDIIFCKDEPTHTASLFLVSSDFSVLLITPYSLTPTAFSETTNEIKRHKMDKCVDNVFCSEKNIVVKST